MFKTKVDRRRQNDSTVGIVLRQPNSQSFSQMFFWTKRAVLLLYPEKNGSWTYTVWYVLCVIKPLGQHRSAPSRSTPS